MTVFLIVFILLLYILMKKERGQNGTTKIHLIRYVTVEGVNLGK